MIYAFCKFFWDKLSDRLQDILVKMAGILYPLGILLFAIFSIILIIVSIVGAKCQPTIFNIVIISFVVKKFFGKIVFLDNGWDFGYWPPKVDGKYIPYEIMEFYLFRLFVTILF